jgi:hypothetical protein
MIATIAVQPLRQNQTLTPPARCSRLTRLCQRLRELKLRGDSDTFESESQRREAGKRAGFSDCES